MFYKPPAWTNTSTIVDGSDLIAGSVKVNDNYNKINTFNTALANQTWLTTTATGASIASNQNFVMTNPGSAATYTLPQISTMSGSERVFQFYNLSSQSITFAANAADKIKNPYTNTDTALGGSKTLMYAPGDHIAFFPNTSTNTWIVTIVRENNAHFYGQAQLTSNISNTFGGQSVPVNSIINDPSSSFSSGVYTPRFRGVWLLQGQIAFGTYTTDLTKYLTAYIATTSTGSGPEGRMSSATVPLFNAAAANNTVNLSVIGYTSPHHTLTTFRLEKDSTNSVGDGSILATNSFLRVTLISRYIP